MALFSDNNGNIIEHEDNFDPNTGENLSVNDFINKVKQKGGNVTPINLFQDKKGQQVAVPYGQEKKFIDLGLKPVEQIEAENKADISNKKVLSGDINSTPNKTDTFYSQLGNSLSLGSSPNIEGAGEALIDKLRGSKDSLSNLYDTNKKAYQSSLTAQQNQHPIESNLVKGIGTGILSVPTGGLNIPAQLGANAALGAAGQANESVNQENSLSQVAAQSAESGLGSALGAGVGLGLGNLGTSAARATGKIAPALLPKNSSNLYKYGVQGEDYLDPAVREKALNDTAGASKGLFNAIMQTGQNIGKLKGNELDNLGNEAVTYKIDPKKVSNFQDLDDQIELHNQVLDKSNDILNHIHAFDNLPPESKYNLMSNINKKLGLKTKPFDPNNPPTTGDLLNYADNLKEHSQQKINDLFNDKEKVKYDIAATMDKNIQPNFVSHSDLMDEMQNAKTQLLNRQKLDKDPDAQKAITRGLDRINGNIESLLNTPNNPYVIDQVKRNLDQDLWDSSGNKIPDYGVRDTLKTSRMTAQNILENASSKSSNTSPEFKNNVFGNINKGYKAIMEAENPQHVFDTHYLTSNDIEDLGNGQGMSSNTRMKLNNLLDLNTEIKNNPDISDEIKNNLDSAIQNLFEISRKDKAARTIVNSHGIPGIVNRTANYVGLLNNSLGINDKISKLSPTIQKLIEISPSFRKSILPALGSSVGSREGQ